MTKGGFRVTCLHDSTWLFKALYARRTWEESALWSLSALQDQLKASRGFSSLMMADDTELRVSGITCTINYYETSITGAEDTWGKMRSISVKREWQVLFFLLLPDFSLHKLQKLRHWILIMNTDRVRLGANKHFNRNKEFRSLIAQHTELLWSAKKSSC